MHEARFYTKKEDGKVQCGLCQHRCQIKPGRRGMCGVRENRDGTLYTLVYGYLVAENSDPIEKKPLFHFLPASKSWSISTVGCNFRCLHCQNYDISQYPHLHHGGIAGTFRSPEEVVAAAERTGCASISYTYVEPTVFYEFARDCMELAHSRSIRNVFVSNGYMTPEVIRDLAPLLDGINIDLKGFSEDFYHRICSARLQPVLDTIRLMHEAGVWVEVTTLVIPGLNDSDEELRDIARFIRGIDLSMPWHVTAFYPTYKLTDRPPTPVATLRRARDIGLGEGLRFVYEGNVPGEGGENTWCPSCGVALVTRLGFSLAENRLRLGDNPRLAHCPECGEDVQGVWS
ncbi:AmmeMemoRadiSam system radical SAM enzyme [Desulfolithobacter sp.]